MNRSVAYNPSMRSKKLLAMMIATFVGLACMAWSQQEPGVETLIGKVAPKLQVTDWLNSKELKLDKLRGKVVVLDFWAFW